jgi:hypothetical protein
MTKISKQHIFVVAPQKYRSGKLPLKPQQLLDNLVARWPPIDVVTDENDPVLRPQPRDLLEITQELPKLISASMYIAHCV